MLNTYWYDRAANYAATKIARFPEHADRTSVVQLHGETNGYTDVYRAHTFYGYAVATVSAQGEDAIAFWPGDEIKDATSAFYLVTDGDTTHAYYVAGWRDEGGYVLLHRVTKHNQGMAPRRAYHFHMARDLV